MTTVQGADFIVFDNTHSVAREKRGNEYTGSFLPRLFLVDGVLTF